MKTAAVVGGGIVGLASALALSKKGYTVTLFERNEFAIGASIRNFGMIWPIGQADGQHLEWAMQSKSIWSELSKKANFFFNENGSIHIAKNDLEWTVLNEVFELFMKQNRGVKLLTPAEVASQYPQVKSIGLRGGLFSDSEALVNPKEAIYALTLLLKEQYGVTFHFGKTVTAAKAGELIFGNQTLKADLIVICGGQDFETLFPETFEEAAITKCKLQMMRLKTTGNNIFKSSICGGLSLVHYASFQNSPSLHLLKKEYEESMPEYLKHGIHVMLAQNNHGELTIGDSHEYGKNFDPFDKNEINELVLRYLNEMVDCRNTTLLESWHGVYTKMTDQSKYFFKEIESGVFILNGVGGTGMTISFGLTEHLLSSL